jgi:hypothetical protein
MNMPPWNDLRWHLLPVLLCASFATVACASNDPAALCIKAARSAAEQTAVPYDALLAISVVETGRNLQPWPWTVNLGGEGHWLDTAQDAANLVQAALDQGQTNIDIGCFQLNYRWHASAFGSLEDMLDPDRNALYAAGYLAEHYARTGDWALSAAAYHSSTPEYADRYRARYEKIVADLGGQPTAAPSTAAPSEVPARSNGFPLLMAGTSGRNGSLVPATSGGLRLLAAP